MGAPWGDAWPRVRVRGRVRVRWTGAVVESRMYWGYVKTRLLVEERGGVYNEDQGKV